MKSKSSGVVDLLYLGSRKIDNFSEKSLYVGCLWILGKNVLPFPTYINSAAKDFDYIMAKIKKVYKWNDDFSHRVESIVGKVENAH